MAKRLSYVDMHTAGEPVRIVTGGYPDLPGKTILEKRRAAELHHDHLRRAMLLEPRGHAGMYGVIPVRASHPNAVMGVLFTHNAGYSTMCGHATIALGRWIVDQGLVEKREPVTEFFVEAPCGPLRLSCHLKNGNVKQVFFESVPAFAETINATCTLPDHGTVTYDMAYGGAYYAILPAAHFGLDFFNTPVARLVDAAAALTNHLRATVTVTHPHEADLGFLYGTILTDGAPVMQESYNLCVFAERQIDRSPTGSGVTARMALDYAKGMAGLDAQRIFRGITGHAFTGACHTPTTISGKPAVTVKVGGQGYYMGEGSFILEDDDPLAHGFALAQTFAAIKPA